MKVVLTGGHGFLGWHTACRLRAMHGVDAMRLGRGQFLDEGRLLAAVSDADVIIHMAGVNRARSDVAVRGGNIHLGQQLANAIATCGRAVRVVYANSTQAQLDNPYGQGKARAGDVLRAAVAKTGGSFANIMLPNLFGEHGRPNYNSFVATFCDAVVNGDTPRVIDDREIPLLHAQQAAHALIAAMTGGEDEEQAPEGDFRSVSAVLELIMEFHELYSRGEIPALTDPFRVDLFNTYRSYVFPQLFPIGATVHADARGELFETTRTHGGPGQTFVSTTHPGATRGDHYHLHKVERFFVVSGEAEICLRRLLHEEVVRIRIDGAAPGFVDMPTMWAHNISNVGQGELITMFWADQLLDPARPDQYSEKVTQGSCA